MARPTLEPTTAATLRRLDSIAVVLSAICAVHCVATPIVLLALPFLTTELLDDGLRIGIAGLGVGAIGVGVVLHKNYIALLPLMLGLALLLGSAQFEHGLGPQLLLSLAASAFLITAHRLNSRACRATCPDCAGRDIGLS